MKRTTLCVLLAGLIVGACSKDTASPLGDATSLLLDDAADLAYNASYMADPGSNLLPGINRLPDNLKLTAEQGAKIKALVTAFEAATKADHDALAAIKKQAEDARKAGKTPAEIDAILKQDDPIRTRLAAAEAKLQADLLAVLTADQKAWLDSHKGGTTCATLTEAQKTQIAALIAAYEQANKADIEAVKAAVEKANAARRAGKTEAEVKALLDPVRAAMDRLKAATDKLNADIQALLTPEQKSASCVRLPKSPGPGGR